MKPSLLSALVCAAALLQPLEGVASPCFEIAVQQYSRQRFVLEAPFNYAQAIRTHGSTTTCRIESLHLGEYSLKISCPDGYKYEIGTTEYCGRDGDPNCEKAIVTSPAGVKSFHPVFPLGDEKSCIPGGAQLSITNKILYNGFDILIMTTHQFRPGN